MKNAERKKLSDEIDRWNLIFKEKWIVFELVVTSFLSGLRTKFVKNGCNDILMAFFRGKMKFSGMVRRHNKKNI